MDQARVNPSTKAQNSTTRHAGCCQPINRTNATNARLNSDPPRISVCQRTAQAGGVYCRQEAHSLEGDSVLSLWGDHPGGVTTFVMSSKNYQPHIKNGDTGCCSRPRLVPMEICVPFRGFSTNWFTSNWGESLTRPNRSPI